MKTCFFCGKQIVGKAEKHHRRPKRYFRKGSEHRKNNIVPVHSHCHRRAHMELDDPRWKEWEFHRAMEPINYGENIFAGD